MDIEQWKAHYGKHAGQPFGTKPGDILITNEEHGLFAYSVDGPCLLIKAVTGSGDYWEAFSTELAMALGLKQKLFVTKRNPRAWAKKYGYKFIRYSNGGVMMGKGV